MAADRELHQAMTEMKPGISQYPTSQRCDFKFNFPRSSHMGGVWERQIRSIRRILSTLLHQSGTQLDDESLRTFCAEAAATINCRPLTVENLNDPMSAPPLSPNQLLTMKIGSTLPPPGNFERQDLYLRKHWRRVQYLANQFWFRWKREFLQSLQPRQKWVKPKRDLQKGDIVLVMDENQPRNVWMLARVDSVSKSSDGRVRKVGIVLGNSQFDSKGIRVKEPTFLERPTHKHVSLVETADESN